MAATVKASKASTKRQTRPKPPQPAAADAAEVDFEVPRLTTGKDRPEKRVPVFYIDDVEYTIPARPRMNIALQFMHNSRELGDSQAMDYLLGKLLGEDGYRALREYDDLTPEQFTQITEIASRLTLGALEPPKD